MAELGNNFERAASLVGKLGDFVFGGVTLNLDSGHDAIADGINDRVASFIDAFGMSKTAILNKESKDGLRK